MTGSGFIISSDRRAQVAAVGGLGLLAGTAVALAGWAPSRIAPVLWSVWVLAVMAWWIGVIYPWPRRRGRIIIQGSAFDWVGPQSRWHGSIRRRTPVSRLRQWVMRLLWLVPIGINSMTLMHQGFRNAPGLTGETALFVIVAGQLWWQPIVHEWITVEASHQRWRIGLVSAYPDRGPSVPSVHGSAVPPS